MVFTTAVNYVRSRGPDEFWRKRRIFKLAAHFIGRRRNCYGIAIRYVHRALVYATKGRKLKKIDMANLWETRITAACEQHDLNYPAFKESLTRSDILLNKKTLADLSCWEPYTFKSLADVAKQRCREEGLNGIRNLVDSPDMTVITRGMLK